MSLTYYYKITAPDAIEAVKAYFAQVEVVTAAGRQFAKRFSGKPMWNTIRYELAGVAFECDQVPPGGADLWTKPDKYGMRRPRVGKSDGHKALKKEWFDNWPRCFANGHEMFEVLGVPSFPSRPGLALRDPEGAEPVVYLCSSEPTTRTDLTEITATEYVKATKD